MSVISVAIFFEFLSNPNGKIGLLFGVTELQNYQDPGEYGWRSRQCEFHHSCCCPSTHSCAELFTSIVEYSVHALYQPFRKVIFLTQTKSEHFQKVALSVSGHLILDADRVHVCDCCYFSGFYVLHPARKNL